MRPSEQIAAEVTSWEGVTSAPHRFGGIEFRYGRRELGHLHGDAIADLPFPRRVHDELLAAGRAREHRWVRDSGWVTRDIDDVGEVIALFRMSYDRAVAAAARRSPSSS